MGSVRFCVIDTCQQTAGAVCMCCQETYCITHLNEHSNRFKAELTPLLSDLEKISVKISTEYLLIRAQSVSALKKWQKEAHEAIDVFHKRKRQEFEEFFDNQHENHRREHANLQTQLDQLKSKENLDQEYIDSIIKSVRSFEQQVNLYEHLQLILSPLTIDEQCVIIHQKLPIVDDYLPLSDPHQTIEMKRRSFSIAANDNLILIEQDAKLCLIDQQLTIIREIPWSRSTIYDMIWSNTLKVFFIITGQDIFTLHEKADIVKKLSITDADTKHWYCGTCTSDNLFLSVMGLNPFIFKYSLLPSFRFTKNYSSIVYQQEDIFIQDLSSNDHIIGILSETKQKTILFDIYSSTSFQRYWTITPDCFAGLHGSRCCALTHNQWMIINPNNSQIIYVSAGGKIFKKEKYFASPIHAVQLNNNILVILTENDLNLHKLL
ncbi:unnamed protein product [Adineta ricciae]|uniref:Uncharacterized protein n=1 Tax=Adineta ricciae TaxID=249248 RepID=A0A814TVJ2_ADIRI|nr:unnamed protein product [Adineta ricciae]CAF1165980.1 unnamed protein product [Adineta ricciae]